MSYPRRRVSSSLRLIGSISAASGILGHPPSRVTTPECVSAFSRRRPPEFFHPLLSPPSKTEGAGNAGCTLHPRSRVQCVHRNAHTSIQVQSEHSGIPCAMVLRLMPRSPWRRIPFASIAAGSMAQPIRLDRMRHRQLDISHGCQNHAVLPYASAPYVLRDVKRSRVASPCIHLPRRRCRVHHIPSRVRDDRDTPLLSRRDARK
jgi:hypothetical protein